MSTENDTENGGQGRGVWKFLRRAPRPLLAAVLGIAIGALCTHLPPPVQGTCELLSRIIPAACE